MTTSSYETPLRGFSSRGRRTKFVGPAALPDKNLRKVEK